MPDPHVHAAVIKAWADGATIEYTHAGLDQWLTHPSDVAPAWKPHWHYRVLPTPVYRYRWVATLCPAGTKNQHLSLYITERYLSKVEAEALSRDGNTTCRLLMPILDTERIDQDTN